MDHYRWAFHSIYNLWRQTLEYFDAHLTDLTATPSKQTFGFFNQNLVMEYSRQRAVVDGVNVDSQVYRLRTAITARGGGVPSAIESAWTCDDSRSRSQHITAIRQQGVPQIARAIVGIVSRLYKRDCGCHHVR